MPKGFYKHGFQENGDNSRTTTGSNFTAFASSNVPAAIMPKEKCLRRSLADALLEGLPSTVYPVKRD